MINESFYFKKELLNFANWLQSSKKRKIPSSTKGVFKIEKRIFTGFFFIRKLIEAKSKISYGMESKKFPLTIYLKHKNLTVSKRKKHKLEEYIDFDQPHAGERDIGFLCNTFIHSTIFEIVVDDENNEKLDGFFVTSDDDWPDKLYFIDIKTVISVFNIVGNDDVTEYCSLYNHEKNTITHTCFNENHTPEQKTKILDKARRKTFGNDSN